ncbi:aminopeptidase P family protein [Luteipulveratus mongoliensis]|uniref:Xaa-Pro aminopeptidase n=1 Tax=Luteipulveratus mongoliensis TaxID=571913 RepID=A0A0K1JI75_9MICO|nr:aminopeptidase P family protein [Luteipulveratus mongoliensis]AKU16280.1 Xaa-Pro aminopeptidase [Luteipulveratus mongoliensis]
MSRTDELETSKPVAQDPRLPRLSESPAFVDYMSSGWDEPDRTPVVAEGAAAAAAQHRARLSDLTVGRTVVIGAGSAPTRNDDNVYDFRVDSGFYWLAGASIERAVLVLQPVPGGHDAVLFLPPPARPGGPEFFSDSAHGELWVGPAPGIAEWSSALQITVRPLEELESALSTAVQPFVGGQLDHDVLRGLGAQESVEQIVSELRLVKDAWEVQQLRRAVDLTVGGFAAVVAEFPTAIAHGGERWLQGTFDRHARTYGNGVGYATIVGSGAHAPTLHWVRCDGQVRPSDAVLLDMGVETRSLYTADVTRTFPASGTFSDVQRQVHDLVEKAQRAALATVAPGRTFDDFHHAAMEVIVRGLHDWSLLPVSVDEALSPDGQHHRRFLVCGVGHHLGLDVHDCSSARYEEYHARSVSPGMAMAVEPGLYFHAHDLSVPPELRGIGVRIEDNVLVTDTGSEVLSAALPLDARGLENWMTAQQVR